MYIETKSWLFRDDEMLLASVDWGQKMILYQATGAKQVDIDLCDN